MPDILIRGMEMPKSGYVELLLKVEDGEVYYNYAGDGEVKAADYLPLPAGHGRLIGADELEEQTLFGEFYPNWPDKYFGVCTKGLPLGNLLNAPTIVPAEGGTDNG